MEVILRLFLSWMLPVIISFFMAAIAFRITDKNEKTKNIVKFIWGCATLFVATASVFLISEYGFLRYHLYIYCVLFLSQAWLFQSRFYKEN